MLNANSGNADWLLRLALIPKIRLQLLGNKNKYCQYGGTDIFQNSSCPVSIGGGGGQSNWAV